MRHNGVHWADFHQQGGKHDGGEDACKQQAAPVGDGDCVGNGKHHNQQRYECDCGDDLGEERVVTQGGNRPGVAR